MKTRTIVLLLLVVIALVLVWPLGVIWALNVLFDTGIPFTFWTWLAVLVIVSAINAGGIQKNG